MRGSGGGGAAARSTLGLVVVLGLVGTVARPTSPGAAPQAAVTVARTSSSSRPQASAAASSASSATSTAAVGASATGAGASSGSASTATASTAPHAPSVGHLVPEWGASGYKNEVIVLMYHEFLTTPIPGDDITPADFAAQLALFHQDGYHVITLSRFIAFVNGQATVPPNALLLTFDNGYLSQYTDAFPLLKKYGYPATLFLIGSWLTPGYAPAGLQTLTSADVKTMVASGLISIGTQGWNVHTGVAVGPNTSEAADIGRAYNPATGKQESLASYDQAVAADLLHAQRALTPYAHAPLQAFAYPFGDYRPRLIRLLHSAGFHYLFAAKLGWGNLQGQSADVLYRLNVGAEGTTPLGALSAIRTVARDTAGDPAWQPPPSMIEVWHG